MKIVNVASDWSENLASRNPESFLGSVSDELPKIQERWELANATESAIKDYRNYAPIYD
jgi:hypothetical protein